MGLRIHVATNDCFHSACAELDVKSGTQNVLPLHDDTRVAVVNYNRYPVALDGWMDRTHARNSDGNLVNVGNFKSDGVNVNNWKPDNANDDLGASFDRSFCHTPHRGVLVKIGS
jgi:hypothetical protein